MFTMCTQVIDLLLQGFEKEWNTASPKRSFFKFKNLRVLVSFLIFFLWTACSSYEVFFILAMRYGVCSFEILCGGTTRWQRMKRDLPPLIPSPSFIYPPCPSQVFHTIEIYVTYFITNSKAAAFTSNKNQDLLICGVSMQLAWLSHFTVVARHKPFFPKKKLSLCLHVYDKAGWTACRILGCSKRDLVKWVTERTDQTG